VVICGELREFEKWLVGLTRNRASGINGHTNDSHRAADKSPNEKYQMIYGKCLRKTFGKENKTQTEVCATYTCPKQNPSLLLY
jgi:hypothetical protein